MLDASVPTSPVHNVRHEVPHHQKVERLREAATKVETYQKASLEAAEALAEIKDYDLWTVEADSFAEYARTAFGYRRRRAYQLAKAGRCYRDLKGRGVDALPLSEAQIRPLTTLSDREDQVVAWELALEGLGLDVDTTTTEDVRSLTQADVDRAVAEIEGSPRDLKDASVQGAHGVLSQRDRDYAALEDALAKSESKPPSPALHAEHYGVLGRLEPADQAEVWSRVAKAKKSGVVVKDGVLEAGPEPKHTKDRKTAVEDAVVALADALDPRGDQAAANPPPPSESGTLRVLLERESLEAETAEALSSPDVIGGSLVVDYSGAEDAVGEAVSSLESESDADFQAKMQAGRTKEYGVQRRLSRTRLEPEVAAWAWHVLVPDPRRSPRAWIPEADAPAPCFAPSRLTQPSKSAPGHLVVTGGDEPGYEIPVKYAVLLAPGVDLLHEAVPDEVVEQILERARGATDFVFLPVTRNTERLGRTSWPSNVRPVVPVTDGSELGSAITSFEKSECYGGLLFDDYQEGMSASTRSRVKKYATAAIIRGEATSQKAYDAVLALRGTTFSVLIGREVVRRPQDTPFGEPSALRTAAPKPALPGSPESGIPVVGS